MRQFNALRPPKSKSKIKFIRNKKYSIFLLVNSRNGIIFELFKEKFYERIFIR